MIKPGFLMLEFLLYFMLAITVTVLTLNWVMVTHVQTTRCIQQTTTTSTLTAVHNLLVRELRSAPVHTSLWKLLEPNFIVWSAGKYDIGWQVQNNVLKRYKGTYNSANQTWHNSSMSIIAENISDILITPQYCDANNTILRSMKCILNSLDASYQKEYEISILNGMFL